MNVANVISKNRIKMKSKLNTFSLGTNSDISTTVMAQSQAARGQKNPSMSANFADLGIGAMINDTPRSKKSMDFGVRKKLYKQRTTEVSKSHLGVGEEKHVRRQSNAVRSFSRQNIKGRASTRNLINPGGLTHSNFI